ncbi:MAG: hypothetical protein HQK97_09895 [Nitrospirae bacterium]|nr:hypothetical protein [Nitrospirota bacterium]
MLKEVETMIGKNGLKKGSGEMWQMAAAIAAEKVHTIYSKIIRRYVWHS